MRSYSMTKTAEAVFQTAKLADKLETEYQRFIADDCEGPQKCLALLDDIKSQERNLPFVVNGLPQMISEYLKKLESGGLPDLGNIDKSVCDRMKLELKPVIEGFVGICRRGYVDYFNDSPDGGCKNVLIEDIYSRSRDKRALIIYIVSPFLDKIQIKGHTNAQDAVTMSLALDDLGYSVDVINPWYAEPLVKGRYDLIIGFRKAFENAVLEYGSECKKIYYLTTMNSYIANMAEIRRVDAFRKRNRFDPKYRRLEYSCLDPAMSYRCDGAICLGNWHTVSGYEGMFKRILAQNASAFPVSVDRDGYPEKRGFLWYGGAGSLHKGVDLCIEAFRQLPQMTLHLVGRLDDDIYEFYKEEIENSSNVMYHGFLYYDDEDFINACRECSYSISVSCSEGQSTAMLTSIYVGLIPVCNDETGIDTMEYGGIRIETEDIASLMEIFTSVYDMSDEEIRRRRIKGSELVHRLHTVDAYRKQMTANIRSFIEE